MCIHYKRIIRIGIRYKTDRRRRTSSRDVLSTTRVCIMPRSRGDRFDEIRTMCRVNETLDTKGDRDNSSLGLIQINFEF